MSLTIDCGEGKHSVCAGWGFEHYLIPQRNDGQRFICACPCHYDKRVTEIRELAFSLHPERRAVVARTIIWDLIQYEKKVPGFHRDDLIAAWRALEEA